MQKRMAAGLTGVIRFEISGGLLMRILCIGDSNTWGYIPGVGLRHEKRWTQLLREAFPDDEIIEEGLCGRTAICMEAGWKELCGIESLKGILLSHAPIDLVIIMLGTNDLKTVFHANARYISDGLEEYIKIIKNPYLWKRFLVPEILIVSPVELSECIVEKEGTAGNFDRYSVEQSRLLAAEIEKVCREYQAEFLNASDYAKVSETDGIHLDSENHRRLSQGIAEKIKKIQSEKENSV